MRSFDTDGTDVSGVFDMDRNGSYLYKEMSNANIFFNSHEPLCEKEISICTIIIIDFIYRGLHI